jgi:hypothetical protein
MADLPFVDRNLLCTNADNPRQQYTVLFKALGKLRRFRKSATSLLALSERGPTPNEPS